MIPFKTICVLILNIYENTDKNICVYYKTRKCYMSETLPHIASVSHMGATYFYNHKPAHKNSSNFRYSGWSSNCRNIYAHADFACVCRFNIICVLFYFPEVVVVVVAVVIKMMGYFPFTDLNNSPILIKILIMC